VPSGSFSELDYENEVITQRCSDLFARKFNKVGNHDATTHISFVACDLVRVKAENIPAEFRTPGAQENFFSHCVGGTTNFLFVMEPKLDGDYTKYNNNFGAIFDRPSLGVRLTPAQAETRKRCFLAAEAFSHFCLCESNGRMLVADLQGVCDFFTDPQIVTTDGKKFGMGNMGLQGIQKWRASHKCNDVCRTKGLAPLDANGVPIRPARAVPAAAGEEPSSFEIVLQALYQEIEARTARRAPPAKLGDVAGFLCQFFTGIWQR
jgi:hypothetical protein